MRPFSIFLIILFVVLQYALWFSPGGLVQIWHLKKSIAVLMDENNHLADRNAIVAADVLDLKQGKEAIEERARNDLGMIKQGETFYQTVSGAG